ncbi:hypothetical protein CY34DRAFT_814555, partial [Suillus luteus UH-Slu-Lm8-n1]
MEAYLEGLTALHSAFAQAEGSRMAGLHLKESFVNPGITRRMLGVPKCESDTSLNVVFHQVAEHVDFRVRFHWEPNSIAVWDNR